MSAEQSNTMPFSYFDAALWSAGATFAFILALSTVDPDSPAASDLVHIGGLQVLVYVAVCALFAWRRQGKDFGELFGLRSTSVTLLVLAFVLGVLLQGPARTIADLIEQVAPTPPEVAKAVQERLTVKSIPHGVALFAVVAVAGPFVEELLYRGAIFTALRPVHGVVSALFISSICFALSHFDSRQWPPILLLGCALGLVRALSGSMWSSTLMHGAFNATTLALVLAPQAKDLELPLAYEIGSWVLSAAGLALFVWVARRSGRAGLARAGDESAVPPVAPSPDGP
jgi:membrane protease YdiL (CAAX protease family)